MHRQWLQQKLAFYLPENQSEAEDLKNFQNFLDHNPQAFDRNFYTPGHVTGSAWVINQDHTKALLHYHLKLQAWQQLGGHADGHPNILEVALREAQEESGLTSIKPLHSEIFDFITGYFPARNDQPEHTHYDLRFIFQADENEAFNPPAEESQQLAWIPLDEIIKYNPHEHVLRLVRKTPKLS
jgi:8-oxo-dGTP pyrophosphatase MutT (NUDIX family)